MNKHTTTKTSQDFSEYIQMVLSRTATYTDGDKPYYMNTTDYLSFITSEIRTKVNRDAVSASVGTYTAQHGALRLTVYKSKYKQCKRFCSSLRYGLIKNEYLDAPLGCAMTAIEKAMYMDGCYSAAGVTVSIVRTAQGTYTAIAIQDYRRLKLSISKGNTKLGAIPSVSLHPACTCTKNSPCWKSCYARGMCTRFKNVSFSWYKNMLLWTHSPARYESQLSEYLYTHAPRAFRWHVGGDIPDTAYMNMINRLAAIHNGTRFLLFTKRFDIVNRYYTNISLDSKPANLIIIYSVWFLSDIHAIDNPHNFPVAVTVGTLDEIPEGVILCSGSCMRCLLAGSGCWALVPGSVLVFVSHGIGSEEHVTKGGRI